MNCPKCGRRMDFTKRSPKVFMPEQVPNKLESLHILKTWVCNSKHSRYPYYILEDNMKHHVGGLGAPDWPLTLRPILFPVHQTQAKVIVECVN